MADSRCGAVVHQAISFDSVRRVSAGVLFDSSSLTIDMGLDAAIVHTCKRSRSIDSGLVADSECVLRGGFGDWNGARSLAPLSQLSVTSKSVCAIRSTDDASESGLLSTGLALSANAATSVGSCDSGLLLREEDDDDAGVDSVKSEPVDVVDLVSDRLAPHRSSFDRLSTPTSSGDLHKGVHGRPAFDSGADRSDGAGDECCGIVRLTGSSSSSLLSSSSSSSSNAASHVTVVAVGCTSHENETCRQSSWLLRLFESKLFDMSIAIQYLFNSKELGVQTYLGRMMLMCIV